MTPSPDTRDQLEELPANQLIPDLMWRAFRDFFESVDGQPAAAPEVVIVNLSIGDPATPFDTLMSAWGRIIDWLSYHYGVLVIVSAGNHPRLPIAPLDSETFAALSGDERRQAILNSQEADRLNRRLIAPAEAINAVTVGAIHHDESGISQAGYAVDPTDKLLSLSPVTALGGGYRRSLKPELAAPGGRVSFRRSHSTESHIEFQSIPSGPGVKVAHPTLTQQAFVSGTSVAAALVTRQAARINDELDRITGGMSLTRAQRAVAIKALLIHGTASFDEPGLDHNVALLGSGNGVLSRDYSGGCAPNEAVVLYLGSLKPGTQQELLFPLPNGLAAREVKQISATLAWLSPVNWRHRQYRQAALSFATPSGDIPKLDSAESVPIATSQRGATTIQHGVWETKKSFASGQGSSLRLMVTCSAKAGLQDDTPINYSVAVSLWVAPEVGVDVYTQVRDQIRIRVRPSTTA